MKRRTRRMHHRRRPLVVLMGRMKGLKALAGTTGDAELVGRRKGLKACAWTTGAAGLTGRRKGPKSQAWATTAAAGADTLVAQQAAVAIVEDARAAEVAAAPAAPAPAPAVVGAAALVCQGPCLPAAHKELPALRTIRSASPRRRGEKEFHYHRLMWLHVFVASKASGKEALVGLLLLLAQRPESQTAR